MKLKRVPDHEDRVRLAEGLPARREERQIVVLRDHATAQRRGEEGDTRLVDELAQLGRGVGPEDAAPAHHERALGRSEDLDRTLDGALRPARGRAGPWPPGGNHTLESSTRS